MLIERVDALAQLLRATFRPGAALAILADNRPEWIAIDLAVRNLIENASRHGLARGDIDVAIDCSGGQCLLRVSNDGEPVPDEETENVFRPYYRLRPGGKSGAGLGLSTVRQIAGQHGAMVTIARKADAQGCVVTVAFPR